jgi:hypothetical protein
VDLKSILKESTVAGVQLTRESTEKQNESGNERRCTEILK